MYQAEKDGMRLTIDQDMDTLHPRAEWDNLGTMVCFHKRYNLGDKHDYRHEDFQSWKEMAEAFNAAVILPLYLYDHSGITMSTGPFSCRWDSGQVGFIFITSEKIIAEYGQDTPEQREKVKGYLQSEVVTYDQFLRGDVYGFTLERLETCSLGKEHAHHEDSCWGFYGTDWKANGIMDHIGQDNAHLIDLLELQ